MFKYFPPERIDVLKNNLICFNNPRHFNDPFEFFSLYNFDNFLFELDERFKNLDVIDHFTPEQMLFYQALNSSQQKVMLTSIKPFIDKLFKENLDTITNNVRMTFEKLNHEFIKITRVLCLTEKPDNILMWAHYSKSHTGFVVEFDQTNEFFHQGKNLKDEYGYVRKVEYKNAIPVIDPISDNIAEHYLIKSEEWRYEQEWRMFATVQNTKKQIIINDSTYDLYTLPSNAIKRVILGCQAEPKFINLITEMIKNEPRYSHVVITQARRSNSKFAIEIDDL